MKFNKKNKYWLPVLIAGTLALLAALDYGLQSLDMGTIVWILAIIFFTLVYFIPAIIGWGKRKHNRVAILVLNIFLGWTFLGWVMALVWATTED